MKDFSTRRKITFLLLFTYEIIRVIFIFSALPESAISVLPLSWYIATPLMFIPFILLYLLYSDSEQSQFYSYLYRLIKFSSLLAFIAFILADLPTALQNLHFNKYSSIIRFGYISIFFLFDAIIIVVFFIRDHKDSKNVKRNNKSNPEEGTECK